MPNLIPVAIVSERRPIGVAVDEPGTRPRQLPRSLEPTAVSVRVVVCDGFVQIHGLRLHLELFYLAKVCFQ